MSGRPRNGQLPFDYGHEPSHAEADFIETADTALALKHILAYPNWTTPWTLLQGPPKSGKTHLARIWLERSGAAAPPPAAVEALSSAAGTAPLLLEDVDRAGYGADALFHLLNQSLRDHRPLLITAREPVANWPFHIDDLKSRARLAAVFTLALSDDIQLSQMFVKLFDDRQLTVDPKIVAYVVARMERSPAEAVALADLIDRIALGRGSAVTRSVVAEALMERGVSQFELNLEGDEDE